MNSEFYPFFFSVISSTVVLLQVLRFMPRNFVQDLFHGFKTPRQFAKVARLMPSTPRADAFDRKTRPREAHDTHERPFREGGSRGALQILRGAPHDINGIRAEPLGTGGLLEWRDAAVHELEDASLGDHRAVVYAIPES